MDSKEDFNSVMIHELRGPIDGIKKISEVMRDDRVCDNKKEYAEYVQMIYESSSYSLELINNLLDMARIETNRLELSVRQSDIKQIINESVQFFNINAETASISVAVSIEESVPESLEFDPINIKQALNNLLSNALKFTVVGGHITVWSFLHKKGESFKKEVVDGQKWLINENKEKEFAQLPDCIVVGVTDSGSGVSENDMDKLFTKFAQLGDANSHRSKKGIGLGLAVTKGIIEAHGGTVGASSREGEGSTFYFTINV